MFVIAKQMREIRVELAETLQDQLGQQLAGTLLAAGALCARLARRQAPEARDAAYLLDMLRDANTELTCLISNLDGGKRR
jgi:signal transduction histidine kinase